MKHGSRQAYRDKGFNQQVAPFIHDMAEVYGRADMLICRAGAMTLAEITALGKASLLIPFPFAANNHQEQNARALVQAGAAEMILGSGSDGRSLGRTAAVLAENPAPGATGVPGSPAGALAGGAGNRGELLPTGGATSMNGNFVT